jgi:RNA polymerase sigma factor (sigma-70 family)
MAMALSVAPISSDGTDVDLVAAVRRGSDAAFEELYARYSHRIGSYVRSMVGDHGRAEDITQEIFISALRRMRETERPIAFKPWIYEIAKNACIDSFRRTRRTQEVSLDADDSLSSADRGRLTVVTTPDDALDSKQAIDDLRGAFGGLSDSHHEILVLRELEGRSYSDIGERLGMSRPVVESTLFRARRRLAEEYDELASGRRCAFVRKMVDSGPQYSLGLRDRRRLARHLAHCQPCRAYARVGGFDRSLLSMPGVAAKIAAVLPIPALLRARWGAAEPGADRGRPSLLAWRSVHTLARSSDVIVVAGPGAGRGAATAAAIVLAGVGGGIVTVSSQPGAPQRTVVHAATHNARTPVVARTDGSALRVGRNPTGSFDRHMTSVNSGRGGASHSGLGAGGPTGGGAAGTGSVPELSVGSQPADPAGNGSGGPSNGSGGGSGPYGAAGGGGPAAGNGGGSNGGGSNGGGSNGGGSGGPSDQSTLGTGGAGKTSGGGGGGSSKGSGSVQVAPAPASGSTSAGGATVAPSSTGGSTTTAAPPLSTPGSTTAARHSSGAPVTSGLNGGVAKGLTEQHGNATAGTTAQ